MGTETARRDRVHHLRTEPLSPFILYIPIVSRLSYPALLPSSMQFRHTHISTLLITLKLLARVHIYQCLYNSQDTLYFYIHLVDSQKKTKKISTELKIQILHPGSSCIFGQPHSISSYTFCSLNIPRALAIAEPIAWKALPSEG